MKLKGDMMNLQGLLNNEWTVGKEDQNDQSVSSNTEQTNPTLILLSTVDETPVLDLDLDFTASNAKSSMASTSMFGDNTESKTSFVIDSHCKWLHSQAGGEKAILIEENF